MSPTETRGGRADGRTGSLQGRAAASVPAAAYAAELLGTFILVFGITATVVAAKLDQPAAGAPFGSLGVALVNGLALATAVAAFSHVSGAHLNPAISVGLAAARRFPWARVPGYVLAQLAGGLLAALATWLVGGPAARSVASLAATSIDPGVSTLRALVTEALVTFVLAVVVVAVTTDDRVPDGVAPLAIGAALTVAVFIAGPLDGAAVNPARALGPMLVAGSMGSWWVFVVGPVVGAVAGAVLYDRVLRRGAPPADPQELDAPAAATAA